MTDTTQTAPADKTIDQIISGNVRAELARRKITQREVAEVLGLTNNSVSRRYRDAQPYTNGELRRISESFDIPFGVLLKAE